ncbi:MAG: hypothetical protein H0Z19_05270 [Archaeoglobus sp.]|uniref:hypothetical protein n=1 Tax=Archaeoglobus sp. TaxID=1872626 RepID=UPI001D2A4425|nr:hypothetical protein [Archaeoglobus sp.]MBO8179878.1 hypothetical protein [Archaeoglobus sp.]
MGRIKTEYANPLLADLYDHSLEGKTAVVVGPMGSRKTTFMLLSAAAMADNDYVMFRDHPDDPQFKNYPGEVVLYHHEEDELSVEKVTESGVEDLDVKTKTYYDAEELVRSLKRGRLNVIWEPTQFEPSVEFIRGVEIEANKSFDKYLKNIAWDPSWFWFEVAWVLLHRDNIKPYTLMWDEAGDILQHMPPGLRWHVQGWFCKRVMKLRSGKVSLFMAAHNANVFLDHRIKPLVMYYIYMAGADPVSNSTIKSGVIKRLKVGQAAIESVRPVMLRDKAVLFSVFEVGELDYVDYKVNLRLKNIVGRERIPEEMVEEFV